MAEGGPYRVMKVDARKMAMYVTPMIWTRRGGGEVGDGDGDATGSPAVSWSVGVMACEDDLSAPTPFTLCLC